MRLSFVLLVTLFCYACGSSRTAFSPSRKYPAEKLERDYTLFRNILQESHPSVSWHTPADSMNYYFDWGFRQLRDSMTEPEFRSVLTYVIAKIRCGHTSTRYSRQYLKWLDTAALPMFPISIKILGDTVLLNNTLRRSHISLPRGTILTSFNGQPFSRITDSLQQHLSIDGYNKSYLDQTLSNRGAFGGWLRLVKGWEKEYNIGFLDSSGTERITTIRLVDPPKRDTTKKPVLPALREKIKRRQLREDRLYYARSIQVDTGLSAAYMTVNTFNGNNRYRSFFRESFRLLKQRGIRHLVVDIRANGGGNVSHSNYLTRMLIDKPYRVGDSLYAISKRSKYGRYIKLNAVTGIFMSFITRKKNDGKYHFGYFERHVFKPIKHNHYNGNVYVLTGPNSFSAASLLANSLKGQSNVTLVGEETGGGAYGNTAWFIPDVTLPETGIRFRLPKFRLVINKEATNNGRGVLPDIEVKPTVESIRQNRDLKVEKVRDLILLSNQRLNSPGSQNQKITNASER